MKIIAKTESFSEFLARGGQVTKCTTSKATKKSSARKPKTTKIEEIDWSMIPKSLKIAYGVK